MRRIAGHELDMEEGEQEAVDAKRRFRNESE